jgi:probable HAF family extracellular repeat protein
LRRASLVIAAFSAVAALLLPPAAVAAPRTARMTTIVVDGRAGDMNDHGEVVGGFSPVGGGPAHSFLWRDGSFTDLGAQFFPAAINNLGQIVGCIPNVRGNCRFPPFHGGLWQDGVVTDLGDFLPRDINDSGEMIGFGNLDSDTAPGPFLFRDAAGRFIPVTVPKGRAVGLHLSNRGSVIGYSLAKDESGCCEYSTGGFLWHRDGSSVDLGRDFTPVAINDHDRVVGCVPDCDGVFEPVVWAHGRRHRLRGVELAPNHHFFPHDINNAGAVAGTDYVNGGDVPDIHAVVWADGHLTRLTALNSYAYRLNDRGTVIGSLEPDGPSVAVSWKT